MVYSVRARGDSKSFANGKKEGCLQKVTSAPELHTSKSFILLLSSGTGTDSLPDCQKKQGNSPASDRMSPVSGISSSVQSSDSSNALCAVTEKKETSLPKIIERVLDPSSKKIAETAHRELEKLKHLVDKQRRSYLKRLKREIERLNNLEHLLCHDLLKRNLAYSCYLCESNLFSLAGSASSKTSQLPDHKEKCLIGPTERLKQKNSFEGLQEHSSASCSSPGATGYDSSSEAVPNGSEKSIRQAKHLDPQISLKPIGKPVSKNGVALLDDNSVRFPAFTSFTPRNSKPQLSSTSTIETDRVARSHLQKTLKGFPNKSTDDAALTTNTLTTTSFSPQYVSTITSTSAKDIPRVLPGHSASYLTTTKAASPPMITIDAYSSSTEDVFTRDKDGASTTRTSEGFENVNLRMPVYGKLTSEVSEPVKCMTRTKTKVSSSSKESVLRSTAKPLATSLTSDMMLNSKTDNLPIKQDLECSAANLTLHKSASTASACATNVRRAFSVGDTRQSQKDVNSSSNVAFYMAEILGTKYDSCSTGKTPSTKNPKSCHDKEIQTSHVDATDEKYTSISFTNTHPSRAHKYFLKSSSGSLQNLEAKDSLHQSLHKYQPKFYKDLTRSSASIFYKVPSCTSSRNNQMQVTADALQHGAHTLSSEKPTSTGQVSVYTQTKLTLCNNLTGNAAGAETSDATSDDRLFVSLPALPKSQKKRRQGSKRRRQVTDTRNNDMMQMPSTRYLPGVTWFVPLTQEPFERRYMLGKEMLQLGHAIKHMEAEENLQEAFYDHCSHLIVRFQERQEKLQEKIQRRKQHSQAAASDKYTCRKGNAASTKYRSKALSHGKKSSSKAEMKGIFKRMYSETPEVLHAKEQFKWKQHCRTNKLRAQMYKMAVQKEVLKGRVNWPTNYIFVRSNV